MRAFQRKYGLTVDGVVGQSTWTELYLSLIHILSAPRLQAALYTPARLELITAVGPPL